MTDEPDPDTLIDRLTAVHLAEVTGPDGITTAIRRPPLLTDLANARTSSIGVGRGGGQQAHARTMLNLDASELLTTIEHRVRTWALHSGIRPTGTAWPPPDRVLTAWHDQTDPTRIDPARIRKLASWVQAIEDLLDPPHRYTLTDPCPLCRTSYVDTAEHHGRALQVWERHPTDRTVVTCRACQHVWHGITGAHELAAQLRRQERTA